MGKRQAPRFRRKIINLRNLEFMNQIAVHRFRLPDGEEGRWESIYCSEALGVATVAITPQGKLVLVQMFRFPVESRVIELPAGHVKPDEDLAIAARRELLEETGYDTEESFEELTRGWLSCGNINMFFVVFLARNCSRIQSPHLDDVEKLAGLEVVEKDPGEIARDISQGNPSYDPLIGYVLIPLLWKEIVRL